MVTSFQISLAIGLATCCQPNSKYSFSVFPGDARLAAETCCTHRTNARVLPFARAKLNVVLLAHSDVPDVAQSKKMEKLLAALNLPQVGEIRLVDPDDESYEEENDGSLFTIELNDRVYTMKVFVL